MRRNQARARLLGSAISLPVALVLAGCGQGASAPGGGGTATAGNPSGPAAAADAPSGEVVGRGAIMQSAPDADVELCMGAMMTSYPPQCGGPRLLGDFSWDDVESEEVTGVTWTDTEYFAVGHYDRAADTFTLTRALSAEPPEGYTPPEGEERDFPLLCDDPFRGGDESYSDPDHALQNALSEHLDTMAGYVESWVSDGASEFNVIVTGDAEAAHAQLREIWPGALCVEQRDAPSFQDIDAATTALGEHAEELGLLSWGGQGRLDVGVVLADEETVERIHEIVAPWLAPEDIVITGSFVPLATN
ncbi:MAG: hypothetical protein Q4G67_05485 [Actinomycetia bacterium]|nr:hypothetical protein [Actinomycetes bacterium]